MKNMKKILALLVAVLMVIGMTAALADTTNTVKGTGDFTITITKDSTDKAAHTYGAYQIFKGDLAEEKTGDTVNSKVLSNIEWGDNIDTTKTATLIGAINTALGLTGENAIASTASAADVAKAISDAKANTEQAKALADAFAAALTGNAAATGAVSAEGNSTTIEHLKAGYYLVKDDAAVTAEGAKTRFIMEVVSNVSVTEKANVPSVSKKVKEKNDTTGEESNWQDAADYDIGDQIPFKLEGTLPTDFADYKTYKVYTFIDTLSAGLIAPSADDITIKVGETSVKDHFDINITGDAKAQQTLTIKLKNGEDLKKWDNPALTKDSKIVVEYNATLNDAAVIGTPGNPNTVKIEFTNNPNGEQDGEKGTTPEDKVVVFTYQINALKVEPDGAGIDEAAYSNKTDAEKANYVKIGDKYFLTKALTGAGFTLYKKVNGSYVAVGNEITGVTTFEFKGTDAGEYKLVETTVPAGYNKAADIEITVAATYDTDAAEPKLKTLTVTPATAGFTVTTTQVTNDAEHITTNGIISGKVVNLSGSTLPSTGGIGTTIFYIAGSLLAIGAAILLITKRRMGSDE